MLAWSVSLSACAVQPAYKRPALAIPAGWDNAPANIPTAAPSEPANWWQRLGDPAVDHFVRSGLQDNPTLAEAAARLDQARAALGLPDAQKLPAIAGEVNAAWSRDRLVPSGGTTSQTSAAIGARLSWEIDLWGRIRESATAARNRLAARSADADGARLSVIADIADTTLALRACNLKRAMRDRDIASRETELRIGRARLAFGTVAPVVVAAAEGNLAAARTDRALQADSCQRLVNALVTLTGMEPDTVRDTMARGPDLAASAKADCAIPLAEVSCPPRFAAALPANVILRIPGVVAAEREAAARWSDIAVARAERRPRIDLVAALTGQWISALGSSTAYDSASAEAGLTAPLFDGGAGAAKVHGAQAAYREAAARLVVTVRSAVRDIEDGLAAQQSAAARIETTQAALIAAQFTLHANEARWRAGAIAPFELEEARRQFNQAQQQAVAAAADRARAWVALMRRTGAATTNPEEHHDRS